MIGTLEKEEGENKEDSFFLYYLEDLCSKLESRLSSREQELLLVLCQLSKQSQEEGRGKSLLKTVFERLLGVQDLIGEKVTRFEFETLSEGVSLREEIL